MGSDDNITTKTFENIAHKWGISHDEAKMRVFNYLKDNKSDPFLEGIFKKASEAWGQTVDEAKKEVLKLLTEELKAKNLIKI